MQIYAMYFIRKQVGPRFCLNPIKIFGGSFGGPTLYENPLYISPNQVRIRYFSKFVVFLPPWTDSKGFANQIFCFFSIVNVCMCVISSSIAQNQNYITKNIKRMCF